MKKLIFILLCFLVIFSCDNKPSKEEVIKEEVVLGRNEIRFIQQNKDFNNIVDEIIKLSPYSTERYEIIYKMAYQESYKYPEQLKSFDIELFSNEEFIKVRDIFNETYEMGLEIARQEDKILQIKKLNQVQD